MKKINKEEKKNDLLKIDLSAPYVDMAGNASPDSLGRILSNYLMEINTPDYIALFGICIKMLEDKPFEMSIEEHKRVSQLVDVGNMKNIMKTRILATLQSQVKGA
jgi:hypothetical protein